MTLGTGIFLSSLFLGLILLFWITKDRWRWSRIILWMVGGIAATAAVLLAFHYELPQSTQRLAKQSEYADLKLGMSQAEVEYVKGTPNEVVRGASTENPTLVAVDKLDEGQTPSDFPTWVYKLATL